MKTHTIKTSKAELLIVELPEGWIFNTYKDQIGFCNEINKPMTQIKGSYTLLGKPDEIREQDARMLVHKISFGFKNYKSKDIEFFLHPKESLLSLLESEIYWENPFGVRNPANNPDFPYLADAQQVRIKRWHEAEQKTFDRNRTLIFKKYGGKCAYCGCELQKGWHVDHIEPAYHKWSDEDIKKHLKSTRGSNEIENLNPACPRCNRWKGTWSVEQFRHEIFIQTERLKRDSASYRLLLDFKRIDEECRPVEFYFETFETDRIKTEK